MDLDATLREIEALSGELVEVAIWGVDECAAPVAFVSREMRAIVTSSCPEPLWKANRL